MTVTDRVRICPLVVRLLFAQRRLVSVCSLTITVQPSAVDVVALLRRQGDVVWAEQQVRSRAECLDFCISLGDFLAQIFDFAREPLAGAARLILLGLLLFVLTFFVLVMAERLTFANRLIGVLRRSAAPL